MIYLGRVWSEIHLLAWFSKLSRLPLHLLSFPFPTGWRKNLLSSFTLVLSLPFIFGVWKVFLDWWQQYLSVNGFGLCLRECYSFSKPDLGLIYENHTTHISLLLSLKHRWSAKNYIFWIKVRTIFWKEQIIYKIKSWHLQTLVIWLQGLTFD